MTDLDARNAASMALAQIRGIADLIAAANADHLDPSTLQIIALHVWELAGTAKQMVDEEWKIAPAPAKARAA